MPKKFDKIPLNNVFEHLHSQARLTRLLLHSLENIYDNPQTNAATRRQIERDIRRAAALSEDESEPAPTRPLLVTNNVVRLPKTEDAQHPVSVPKLETPIPIRGGRPDLDGPS